MTLDQIREKFPTAHYAPDPECDRCSGTGLNPQDERRPCLCIFVGDRRLRGIAREILGKMAREFERRGKE